MCVRFEDTLALLMMAPRALLLHDRRGMPDPEDGRSEQQVRGVLEVFVRDGIHRAVGRPAGIVEQDVRCGRRPSRFRRSRP